MIVGGVVPKVGVQAVVRGCRNIRDLRVRSHVVVDDDDIRSGVRIQKF